MRSRKAVPLSALNARILDGWELTKSDLKAGVAVMLGARREALRSGDTNAAFGALMMTVRAYRTAEDFRKAWRVQRRVVNQYPSPGEYWTLGNIAAELSLAAKLRGERGLAIRYLRLAARGFSDAARLARRKGHTTEHASNVRWVEWAKREIESMCKGPAFSAQHEAARSRRRRYAARRRRGR